MNQVPEISFHERCVQRRTVMAGFFGFMLILGGAWPERALAHDSPEHVAEMLTARMELVGRNPNLLWRRATEYRAIGKLDAAEKDLREAVRKRPEFLQARLDLSRVQLSQGRTKKALSTIEAAMTTEKEGTDPMVRLVHAEILGAAGRPEEAVRECNRAIETADPGGVNAEWYLVRCQLQYRIGQFQQAADDLKRGFDATGNAVLEAEWIDAALDAGVGSQLLDRINANLSESRYKASWWIRRGRALTQLGRITEAQTDYLAAITELGGRLRGLRPDFSLLAERGLAYALIGDVKLARAELAKARSAGADEWGVARLERIIAQE